VKSLDDRQAFGIVQVVDVSVTVGFVGDPVKLQVHHVEPRLFRLKRELGLQDEAQAVRGRLDTPVAHFPGIAAGFEEMGR